MRAQDQAVFTVTEIQKEGRSGWAGWDALGRRGWWDPGVLIFAFLQIPMALRANDGGKNQSSWINSCLAMAQVGVGSAQAPALEVGGGVAAPLF